MQSLGYAHVAKRLAPRSLLLHHKSGATTQTAAIPKIEISARAASSSTTSPLTRTESLSLSLSPSMLFRGVLIRHVPMPQSKQPSDFTSITMATKTALIAKPFGRRMSKPESRSLWPTTSANQNPAAPASSPPTVSHISPETIHRRTSHSVDVPSLIRIRVDSYLRFCFRCALAQFSIQPAHLSRLRNTFPLQGEKAPQHGERARAAHETRVLASASSSDSREPGTEDRAEMNNDAYLLKRGALPFLSFPLSC